LRSLPREFQEDLIKKSIRVPDPQTESPVRENMFLCNMQKPMFRVIFRACDLVNAVNKQPRPFNLSKADLIRVCFKSLCASLQPVPHTITVLGDKLSNEMMDFFASYPVELSNGDYGNDESIRQSVTKALSFNNEEDWIYFCEDDYLHRPESFQYISNLVGIKDSIVPGKLKSSFKSMLSDKKPGIAIFPPDYPDRYWPSDLTQHFVFHSEDCHWRQVNNVTFTFIMQLKHVKKYRTQLMKSSVNANDGYLSKVVFGKHHFINKLLCLSPLPGLSSHMHVNTMTPLVDWKKVIEIYK
jgi:hypothetical protein